MGHAAWGLMSADANLLRQRFEARWTALAQHHRDDDISLRATKRAETFGSAETLGPSSELDPAISRLSVHGGVLLPRLSLSTGGLEGDAPVASSDGVDLTLVRALGQGGMGTVYLAHQRSLDRNVAVKITHPAAPPSASLALIHEGRLAGSLEHPNIVPVHALGLDDSGRPILVVKRIEGVSWAELLADKEHSFWKRVVFANEDRLAAHLEILMHVCNALHMAHSRSIVHRDVKPDNVMIGEFGEVYLVDWGVARRLTTRLDSSLDEPLVGTPAYMAPEMVHGDADAVDSRTDVYLLGATLHELLTGTPPHDKPNLYEALLSASLSEVRVYPEDVPAELSALCQSAMARSMDLRPTSAATFREHISSFLRHRASLALTTAAAEKLAKLESSLAIGKPEQLAGAEAFAELSECRFGFKQALLDWPHNGRAKEGLLLCLSLLIEREICVENPTNARAWLSQYEGEREGFEKRIAEVEERLENRRRIEQQAALMAHELNADVGRRARTLFVSVVLGLGAMAMTFMSLREASTRRPAPWSDVLSFDAVTVSLLIAGLIFGRKKLLMNLYNRRLLWTLTASFSMSALNDVLCSLRGVHVWTAGAIGQILVGGCLVVAAINTTRSLLLPAFVQIFAGILSSYIPWATGAIGTIAIMITVFLILRTSRSL